MRHRLAPAFPGFTQWQSWSRLGTYSCGGSSDQCCASTSDSLLIPFGTGGGMVVDRAAEGETNLSWRGLVLTHQTVQHA
ncbi:hypothetical protein PS655_04875 [Pseudomonas fluorescens]|uniref:Uncharacterized protein n=1 Tax=Pseudomonas fluorescens TaxID=294 RepID=A0A5E6WRD4_PSEFL|nr:hypothetical protein PS655_04875 [Pseudomonas fluorescens]